VNRLGVGAAWKAVGAEMPADRDRRFPPGRSARTAPGPASKAVRADRHGDRHVGLPPIGKL